MDPPPPPPPPPPLHDSRQVVGKVKTAQGRGVRPSQRLYEYLLGPPRLASRCHHVGDAPASGHAASLASDQPSFISHQPLAINHSAIAVSQLLSRCSLPHGLSQPARGRST
ncbi:hypothetical protein LX32DRAFT_180739 [Colletotrichum zoysiae]|uniref:Uncharacterized protein n=1 Tax=Colletotrichum zoysiae TaxID=1216348 RepID=A0AAD9HPD1_9PEZI|nr:hypothetical protein LX32DRAFT_180739 [Colletotrichum zoysiae]